MILDDGKISSRIDSIPATRNQPIGERAQQKMEPTTPDKNDSHRSAKFDFVLINGKWYHNMTIEAMCHELAKMKDKDHE